MELPRTTTGDGDIGYRGQPAQGRGEPGYSRAELITRYRLIDPEEVIAGRRNGRAPAPPLSFPVEDRGRV